MLHFMTLSGFLGAGKTTTLLKTAEYLRGTGREVAVITNDQGTDLVDTQLARSSIGEVGEVTGGCFCCRFEDLLEVTQRLADEHRIDTVIAEAVGSCTDLQATVVRPLRAYYGDQFTASPLVTVAEPYRLAALRTALSLGDSESDLSYLFGKQLQEADVIALNKIDLLDEPAVSAMLAGLRAQYPSATVLGYSAKSGEGLRRLIEAWLRPPPRPAETVDVDYDRYARAEAALAWLNQTLTVTAPGGFDPNAWVRTALEHLSATASSRGWIVGHAKVSLQSSGALAKGSLTASGAEPVADVVAAGPFAQAEARINARVACEPGELDQAAAAAAAAADAAATAQSRHEAGTPAFKPGYPQPRYRLPAL